MMNHSDSIGTCKPIDGHQTYNEPTCKLCNAGGQAQCKFCGAEFGIPCPTKSSTVSGASTKPADQTTKTTAKVTTKTTTSSGPGKSNFLI